MASATAVKIAAIFMLVLTMGHLMAEASPQPRRLLAETEHAGVSGNGNPGLPGDASVMQVLEPALASVVACKPGCLIFMPAPVCIC
ncbi:hypothetical protein SETIT_8G060000v2 [Setaria italica]|uniref:Uncharacterized protein n=1 Tax=Setaria italica TaxID=4555 RepID=K3ZKM6_SETIT|nr:hypothetical protein SETIT_8G060000v2 [Setaria italica]